MKNSVRRQIALWYDFGVEAVRPEEILPRYSAVHAGSWVFKRGARELKMPLPPRGSQGRLRVIALGKAARGMATGFSESLLGSGFRVDDGLIIARDVTSGDPPWREILGDHPLPGVRSEQAARELLRFIGTPTESDAFVFLLSGGASALCALPVDGVTLEQKCAATRELMHAGAPIEEINRLRCELSAIKGGKLLRWIKPARVATLAISDVQHDDPAIIGSAPTYDPPGAACLMIAGLDDAMDGICAMAARDGVEIRSLGRSLYGCVDEEASRLVASIAAGEPTVRPRLWLAGGEPVVRVCGKGRGGRAQELAVRIGRELAKAVPERQVVGLAAGTDGTDGPTDAAGGYFDSSSFTRSRVRGIDLDRALENNDSYTVLQALGDLYITGPTGTNVADLVLALELPR